MKRKSKGKALVAVMVIALVLAGAGIGGWYLLQNRGSEPVNVYPFQYIGMTEYWGDSQESYGPVSTDRIQTVFLSDTQSVTEVLVQSGDTVKKGDVLMTYDTTLSDISLERERLEVEKLKLQLENAREELQDIKNMKPMVIPSPQPEEETQPNLGTALDGDYRISQNRAYDGSSAEKSLILWLRDSATMEDAVFEAVLEAAKEYQQENVPAPSEPVVPPAEETEPTEEPTEESTEDPTEDPAEETTEEPTEDPTEESTEAPATEPTVPAVEVDRFFMVVKITEGNMSLGFNRTWQGMEVSKDGESFRFKFFDASGVNDHMTPQQVESMPSVPQIDYGSGFTAAQIAQMRSEKEKEIKDLQFRIKMAEANYAIKQTEADSGQVVASIDGMVVSLLSEEEARQTMQPIIKLSGGGGFYVEGTVSELEKDKLQPGQEVTVMDWNTGMEYMGTVQSVSDYPSADGYWNGMGNPNASYYPFTVFLDESADLQAGSYVNVVYSTATTEQGVYLENPFLRTEEGSTYVYLRGADGKLEKRLVTTGKSLWGNYTQILEGVSPEDFIAFPYGKQVAPGADTVESDLSALYG